MAGYLIADLLTIYSHYFPVSFPLHHKLTMAETFDYIIVGGGTCGPVVAGRLSEDPNLKVLILEAGADNKDLDNVHMPGA